MRTKISLHATGLALLLVLALSGSTTAPVEITNPFIGPSNCTSCPMCLAGHTGQLVADSDYQRVHEWCMEQEGCPHPGCTGFALIPTRDSAEVEVLHYAALDGDLDAMATLLAEAPAKYQINEARHAFQVVGCKEDNIVAHIPLNPIELSQVTGSTLKNLASR